jgi:CheY-like chemotaxis protein
MHNNLTVLVVDDEALIRMEIIDNLEERGCLTREAACAAEAIEVLEDDATIKVVLTDIEMPGSMDGLALSHYIRDRWPPTFLIISSGRKRPLECEMPAGAAFLAKPHHSRELANILKLAECDLE